MYSMQRLSVQTVLVVAGALSIAIVSAQQAPAAVQLEKVKDGLYVEYPALKNPGLLALWTNGIDTFSNRWH